MSGEQIAVTQYLMGLKPYALIRLEPASDGSGETSLVIEAGGGAEENPMTLPLMAVTECAAEASALAQMLQELYVSGRHDRRTLEVVTRELNPDWLPFVFRF